MMDAGMLCFTGAAMASLIWGGMGRGRGSRP